MSVMHPAWQVKSRGSQIGWAVPQLAFERHATQRSSPRKQNGAPAGQSVLLMHWTHCCAVASHSGADAGQSVFVLHCTQAPLGAQSGEPFGQSVAVLHAAWQVWSPGQQFGVAALQSAFVLHTEQWPSMQYFAAVGQSVFARHWTQPREE